MKKSGFSEEQIVAILAEADRGEGTGVKQGNNTRSVDMRKGHLLGLGTIVGYWCGMNDCFCCTKVSSPLPAA